MDLTLLAQTLAHRGAPAFRARQVGEWAARGATGYDAMANLPRALRAAARPRHHHPPPRDRDGRLDPRDRAPDGVRDADPPRALAARRRPGAAQRADARQRPLSAPGRARGLPRLPRPKATAGVR